MKVLFDTNVILDVLLQRQPYDVAATKLMAAAELSQISGYLGATTVTTVFYLYTKASSSRDANKAVDKLLKVFGVAPVNHSALQTALSSNFKDYEDAVLHEAGIKAGVDCVVTRNPKDFSKASLNVYKPDDLVTILGL
ncbi:MAG: PIN domain-containing protein [Trueperaceae bacterium]